ncbi:DNA cytosine methyltransferase [Herbaspirillum chlorophenolicum]|uniref:DNA (cytosine-5-)-methyltransferase n=1 Tax=Herbaspirillum chlorophenolicum TaxID=211589 RepID=A0ABW8F1W0_9BURK
MNAVELYAGAGGLAMGVSLAGFKSLAVVEWDKWACDTIRENQRLGFPLVENWPLFEGDVRNFDWTTIQEEVDLLAGGPPCQPFSMGGKHKAHDDARDMFPATVDIVRQLRPKAFILENVKGLTRSTFANYYQYILLQLEFPEVPSRKDEEWFDHFLRLQTERSSGKQKKQQKLTYNVVPTLVNAANYGIPQKRERVFIVGFRSDLGVEWGFPAATHSYERLLHDQWITGEYWDRHGISRRSRPTMPVSVEAKVRKMASSFLEPDTLPWRTVRDAVEGLPSPNAKMAAKFANHRFQAGAKIYPGHTGSPLDLPAKTLKAGDHGVPGGENMLVHADGSVRYFSVRESARIQTFPEGFLFHGSWTETMRQLGNAVPVALGHIVARSVAERLVRKKIEQLQHRSTTASRGAA